MQKTKAKAWGPIFRDLRPADGRGSRPGQVGGALAFDVVGLDLGVVNAVRRYILADVPNVCLHFQPAAADAVDAPASSIVFTKNTSALHNEILAHRVALVPLCFAEPQLESLLASEELCKEYSFELDVRCEESATASRLVTTKDIAIVHAGRPIAEAMRDSILPANPLTGDHILLMKLRPGEEMAFHAHPVAGCARQHAVFCPVSVCTYTFKADPVALEAELAKIPAEDAAKRQDFMALDAARCFARDAHGEPYHFVFALETVCGMRPEYLVMSALVGLRARVLRLLQGFEAQDAQVCALESSPVAPDDLMVLTISGEGHTLGNLLQSLLFNRYVRDGGGEACDYVGYTQPHPLESKILLKFRLRRATAGPASRDEGRAFLAEALAWAAQVLLVLARRWKAASKVDIIGGDQGQGGVADEAGVLAGAMCVPVA